MDHVLIAVCAHNVDDRVCLANVREKAVAEALAGVRPRHQPRDVVEVDRVPHDLRGTDRLCHLLHALVTHRHHRDVGLDRRERVVRRLRARFRQRVEQRGLARVGHADDSDAGAHCCASSQDHVGRRRAQASQARRIVANAFPRRFSTRFPDPASLREWPSDDRPATRELARRVHCGALKALRDPPDRLQVGGPPREAQWLRRHQRRGGHRAYGSWPPI
jgi:hypothetical protein